MEKPFITKVRVIRMLDSDADLSHIGEYTDRFQDWAICRCCGEYLALVDEDHVITDSGMYYRFFLPYAGGETPGTEDYQKYGKQDYARMERICRGDLAYFGIVAEAEVTYHVHLHCCSRLQRFTSAGLWGIESDCEENDWHEIMESQLTDLKTHLKHFNVDTSNWDELTANIEIEDK